jgi:hypothetical protein
MLAARITRAYKLRQQPVEPWQRELAGVLFCDGQDAFFQLHRLCRSVCHSSHTARIFAVARNVIGTDNTIIGSWVDAPVNIGAAGRSNLIKEWPRRRAAGPVQGAVLQYGIGPHPAIQLKSNS